jgi:hypothetical protein
MRAWTTVVITLAVAGALTGTAMAAPTGARAADGQSMLLGQENGYASPTTLTYTSHSEWSIPAAPSWNWPERDWTPWPGLVVNGGSQLDYVFSYNVLTASATIDTTYTKKLTALPENPSTTAIVGQAGATGRGAQLSGGAAQLQLMPSTASTHPSGGKLGDLFLDKSGRLWFCKGGTTWKQIA